MRSRIGASLLAVALCGCGGGGNKAPLSPTGFVPPPDTGFPAGTVISIVSGETGMPVAGAALYVGGRPIAADAAGRVSLPERLELNAPVDAAAPGHLDRLTRLRSRDPITLWPKQSPTGLNEHFTAILVYTSASADTPPLGGVSLIRLADSTRQVFLVPAPSFAEDRGSLAALESAVPRINHALEGRVTYAIAESPPPGAVHFDVTFDPSDSVCGPRAGAFARRRFSGFTIVGGQLNYCLPWMARSVHVNVHEIGHSVGLGHSPDNFDVMSTTSFSVEDFTARERLAMRLMSLRPPSNAYPDSDRHLVFLTTAWSSTIVCPE